MPLSKDDRILGCMLGGGVGDALGAPIEFARLSEIRARFGDDGPADFVPAYGKTGAITDDTQMTLFTAEALLAESPNRLDAMLASYMRWLGTQGESAQHRVFHSDPEGWLSQNEELWSRRAPGNTCLSALMDPAADMRAKNDSKGCGGVMRVAPIGIACKDAFAFAVDAAWLTHGHPSGTISAGAFAHTIARLLCGDELPTALASARDCALHYARSEEVTRALDAALDLAARGNPSSEKIETLGGGWVGEEAFAIAAYAALVARDFEHGVRLAVTHSGDSDSTGAIAGHLLGVMHGQGAIPKRWLDGLELRDVIMEIAHDLMRLRAGERVTEGRYPR